MRWTTVSTRALHEEPAANGRYAVVVAFTDITERREAQQALERTNAELAQFAYVASHDLSEPLRMVSSYLQLLRRRYHGQIDEDADEFIDFAVEGANRMRALIEDLLAYSRAGRGAEPRPIDLAARDGRRALLARRGGRRRPRAGAASAPLPTVLGDRLALAQLLQNLVANALKFRRGPSACVWVDAPSASTTRCGASRSPTTASGSTRATASACSRCSSACTTARRSRAPGIGLAICRKIVERQGGEIWVDDREGGGTVFSLHAPRGARARRSSDAGARASAARAVRPWPELSSGPWPTSRCPACPTRWRRARSSSG